VPNDTAKTYAQNLWQFANYITGFSIVQAIVVLVAAASNPPFHHELIKQRCVAIAVIIVLQPLLMVAVGWCHSRELRLLQVDMPQVRRIVWVVCAVQISILAVVALSFRDSDFERMRNKSPGKLHVGGITS
jgi:hypothetical protein